MNWPRGYLDKQATRTRKPVTLCNSVCSASAVLRDALQIPSCFSSIHSSPQAGTAELPLQHACPLYCCLAVALRSRCSWVCPLAGCTRPQAAAAADHRVLLQPSRTPHSGSWSHPVTPGRHCPRCAVAGAACRRPAAAAAAHPQGMTDRQGGGGGWVGARRGVLQTVNMQNSL